jgi:uncharacterized protein (TIGR01777 family)
MPVSAQALFDWHERPGAFDRLTPAWMPVEVRHREGGIRDGARVTIALPMGPVSIPWTLGHTGYQAGEAFRDIQIRGPFRSWEHVHRMEPVSDRASVLDDRITFELPLPPLGGWVAGWYTRAELARLLQWRHALTRNDLARHARFAARGPRTIAITGASGMVGSALVPFLTTGGHRVRTIGRGAASAVRWDPARGALDGAALDGVDAVVHLAGENVGARWTAARRRAIVDSRLQGTRLIAETIARMPRKPEVLVSASAIGIYGVRGDEWLDESSTLGDDFLAEVGRQWEAATAPAREAGVRVVHLRIGIVLAAGGGALGKMLLPFQLGVGGVLGTGRQWMSWISREDLIGAIHHAIQTPALTGAVNAVAPTPVTNREFTAGLGQVLRRPTIAPVPDVVLRMLFGEMAEGTVLASQRVRPTALEGSGFSFLHRTLDDALRFELGRP